MLPIMGDRSQVLTPDAVTSLYLVKMREVLLGQKLDLTNNFMLFRMSTSSSWVSFLVSASGVQMIGSTRQVHLNFQV